MILQGDNVRYADNKNQTDFASVAFADCMYMLPRRKAKVNWKSVGGAFPKPRRLLLVKGSDGLDHCPVTAVDMQDLQAKELSQTCKNNACMVGITREL